MTSIYPLPDRFLSSKGVVPPEHLALVSCLNDMQIFYFGCGEVKRDLDRLFIQGNISNGDPCPWELCRWRERYVVVDNSNVHWLAEEGHPNISPEDFLACCDPDCFGVSNFWNTYSEAEFKAILEHTFSVMALTSPRRKAEYVEALKIHGMRLVNLVGG